MHTMTCCIAATISVHINNTKFYKDLKPRNLDCALRIIACDLFAFKILIN